MRPFQTTGKCCIPCSGFYGSDGFTDPRDYGVQYVSIDDGAGGYIETCSGSSGLVYPNTLPTLRGPCCSANVHGTTQPFDCNSWDNGGQKTVTCTVGGGGTTPFCRNTSVLVYTSTTWVTMPCSSACTSCCGASCTDGFSQLLTPTCCTRGGTGPSYSYQCYCRYSGVDYGCNPFVWQEDTSHAIAGEPHCRFTGLMYNNDGYAPATNEGFNQLYFDVCKGKYVLETSYTGINNQWPTGKVFVGDCNYCDGLDKCRQEDGYWYGYFEPEDGTTGSAFVCISQGNCAFPEESKSICKTHHGLLGGCNTTT